MSNLVLSKDADYLICLIYKHYLELRDNGFSKSEAKKINSLEDTHYLITDWSLDDIHETCLELSNKNLLSKEKPYIDEEYSRFSVSDEGIIYMENRFSNKINKIVDYIIKLKP